MAFFTDRSNAGKVAVLVAVLTTLVVLTKLLGRLMGTFITFVVRYGLKKPGIAVGSLVLFPMRVQDVSVEIQVSVLASSAR